MYTFHALLSTIPQPHTVPLQRFHPFNYYKPTTLWLFWEYSTTISQLFFNVIPWMASTILTAPSTNLQIPFGDSVKILWRFRRWSANHSHSESTDIIKLISSITAWCSERRQTGTCAFFWGLFVAFSLTSDRKMVANINLTKHNTLPVLYKINSSTVISSHKHYIAIIYI